MVAQLGVACPETGCRQDRDRAVLDPCATAMRVVSVKFQHTRPGLVQPGRTVGAFGDILADCPRKILRIDRNRLERRIPPAADAYRSCLHIRIAIEPQGRLVP